MFGRFGTAPKSLLHDPPDGIAGPTIRIASWKALAAAANLNLYPEVNALWQAYITSSPIDHRTVTAAIETLEYFEGIPPASVHDS